VTTIGIVLVVAAAINLVLISHQSSEALFAQDVEQFTPRIEQTVPSAGALALPHLTNNLTDT
jgi:hypothetical protein